MKAERRSKKEKQKIKGDLDRFMFNHQLSKRDLFWFAHMVDHDRYMQEQKRKANESVTSKKPSARPA